MAEDLVPVSAPEIRRLLYWLFWSMPRPAEAVLSWSRWRRRHQQVAKRCHYRRRLKKHGLDVQL